MGGIGWVCVAFAETEHPFSAVSEFPRVHELSTLDTSLPAAVDERGKQFSVVLKLDMNMKRISSKLYWILAKIYTDFARKTLPK